MVRALLDGRKSQTRRVIKPQPELIASASSIISPGQVYGYEGPDGWMLIRRGAQPRENQLVARCPYGVPGDRLYVRESWRTLQKWDELAPRHLADDPSKVTYEADPERRNPLWAFGRLRPGIHMPRWASRIMLNVTDVRVERLQDISAEDADAECFGGDYPENVLPEIFPRREGGWGQLSLPECYGRLWDHINGPGSWDANPWVWCLTFDRATR